MKNTIENPKFGWSTIFDMKNRLVIHVSLNIKSIEVDNVNSDPDGVPVVWIEGRPVTRVRKMTDEEFEKHVREVGIKWEIEAAS